MHQSKRSKKEQEEKKSWSLQIPAIRRHASGKGGRAGRKLAGNREKRRREGERRQSHVRK